MPDHTAAHLSESELRLLHKAGYVSLGRRFLQTPALRQRAASLADRGLLALNRQSGIYFLTDAGSDALLNSDLEG